jgi:hypothetical protein
MKKGLKTMNEKTMGAIPVSALERLEQSAVKLSLITFACAMKNSRPPRMRQRSTASSLT